MLGGRRGPQNPTRFAITSRGRVYLRAPEKRGFLKCFCVKFGGVNPSETAEQVLYMTPGELSAILSISDIEISRLARRGILQRIPSPDKSNSFLYPVLECAAKYIKFLKSKGQQDRDRYWAARAQAEKQRARQLTTENDKSAGRLIDAREVDAQQRELAIAIRSRLSLIPLRLANRLDGNGDRGAIEAAAEAEINEALYSLSEIGNEVSELSRSDTSPG